jgi:lipid A disaccharide synthetase
MANLLIGCECYPEYLQGAARPDILATRLREFFNGRREFAEIALELRRQLRGQSVAPGEWLAKTIGTTG